jgi:hypothetical protein
MIEQGKRMQAMLQQAEKMFGHRVDLAKVEVDLDKAEAQAAVDAMQARQQ